MRPVFGWATMSVAALLACSCSTENAGRTSSNGGASNGSTGRSNGSNGGSTNGSTTGNGGGCSGLECNQVSCNASDNNNLGTTTVRGRVTAPNGLDPVYDAAVYVPLMIPEFPATVQCEVCNEPLGGTPITTISTDVNGNFVLPNVPVAQQVPIVIQKGRFRRIIPLNITKCTDNPLTPDQARLPKNKSEGDLPKMAVAVGDYDQIECVLRSIGIDDSEFTAPGGGGAVELYQNGEGGGGFGFGGSSASEFEGLLTDATKLSTYNLVFINCTGNTFDQLQNPTAVTQNLYNYVNTGGRLYVTDWSYDYMEQVSQFSPYIFYDGGGSMTAPQPVHQAADANDTSDFSATVADSTLASWLDATKVITAATLTIQDLLGGWVLMDSTSADQSTYPSQTWIHGTTNGADRPLTVTFDYNMCGKVLYSSYHTREPGGADPLGGFGGGGGSDFPSYCQSTASTMIAQEKVLEYLILQISACVGPIS